MHTTREPTGDPDANRDSVKRKRAPRIGVRKMPTRHGRPNAFGVQWSEQVWDAGKSQQRRVIRTKYFPTAERRDKRFNEIKKEKRAGSLRTMDRHQVDQWAAFVSATEGTPWTTVVEGWRAHLRQSGLTPCTVSIAEHFGACLDKAEQLKDAHKISPDTFRQKKHKWGLFAAQFGDLKLTDMDSEDIEEWLEEINFDSMTTRDNYLKHASFPFSVAVKQHLILENPCDGIARLAEDSGDDRKLTVPQTAALFHTALTFTDAAGKKPFLVALGRLAMEFFAGIRFGSATRLERKDVNQEDKGVLHPKKSIKTRRRQYVEGFPDVLWAWLAIAPEAGWGLTPRQYLALKSELFRVARVPHPRNCARHSFATYHVASRTNPGLTAYLLCHVNQQKLWDTYKGNATKAEGLRYEGLLPQAVKGEAKEWYRDLKSRAGDSPAPAVDGPSPDRRRTVRARRDEFSTADLGPAAW